MIEKRETEQITRTFRNGTSARLTDTAAIARGAESGLTTTPTPTLSDAALKEWDEMVSAYEQLEVGRNQIISRFNVAREALITAVKERDNAIRTRQKVEGTLAELQLQATNSSKEQQEARRERDALKDANKQLELKLNEMQLKLAFAQDQQSALAQERDLAVESRRGLEAEIAEYQMALSLADQEKEKFAKDREKNREFAISLLEPCRETMKSAILQGEDVIVQAAELRLEMSEKMEALENIVRSMTAQISGTRFSVGSKLACLGGLNTNGVAMSTDGPILIDSIPVPPEEAAAALSARRRTFEDFEIPFPTEPETN